MALLLACGCIQHSQEPRFENLVLELASLLCSGGLTGLSRCYRHPGYSQRDTVLSTTSSTAKEWSADHSSRDRCRQGVSSVVGKRESAHAMNPRKEGNAVDCEDWNATSLRGASILLLARDQPQMTPHAAITETDGKRPAA
jgi:hypothetical protein